MILRKKLFEEYLCKGIRRTAVCFLSDITPSATLYSPMFPTHCDITQFSLYTTSKHYFSTQKPNTSQNEDTQIGYKKAIETVKSLFVKEELEKVKAAFLKKGELTLGDVLLFYSLNPKALPKNYLNDALTAAKKIANSKQTSELGVKTENYKILIFCRSLIKPLEAREAAKFVSNLKGGAQDPKGQSKQTLDLLIYLTGQKLPPSGNEYDHLNLHELTLNFVLQELLELDLFSEIIFSSLKKSNFQIPSDIEYLLVSMSHICRVVFELKNPKRVPNHKQYIASFYALVRSLASAVDKFGPSFSKHLYDALIAGILGKSQHEKFALNELLIITIQSRTASLLTMPPPIFSRTIASISIFHLHRINKKTVEAFGDAVSEYLIQYGKNLDTLGWNRIVYAFGKYFPLNPSGILVIKDFIQNGYTRYKGQSGYPSLFVRVLLCGINTHLITKENIANYYEGFNQIVKMAPAKNRTQSQENNELIKVYCAFARGDLYSWKLWEHFSKIIGGMSDEEFKTNFHVFYLLHHFDLFMEEIDDEETKKMAEFLTRKHHLGPTILKNQTINFYFNFKEQMSTQFGKGLTNMFTSRGITVIDEYPGNFYSYFDPSSKLYSCFSSAPHC